MPAITVSTKRKLSLLQLAEELGNVSKVCGSWAIAETRSTVPQRCAASFQVSEGSKYRINIKLVHI